VTGPTPELLRDERARVVGDVDEVEAPEGVVDEDHPQDEPASPTRFTTNALRPAADALSFLYQNPMSRYEQRPTPPTPRRGGQVPPRTRRSMKKVKRFR